MAKLFAEAGAIRNFTGIDDPYEAPLSPELVVRNGRGGVEECVERVIRYLRARGYIARKSLRAPSA